MRTNDQPNRRQINALVKRVANDHPHATKLVGLWANGRPIVEVWTGDSAQIVAAQ